MFEGRRADYVFFLLFTAVLLLTSTALLPMMILGCVASFSVCAGVVVGWHSYTVRQLTARACCRRSCTSGRARILVSARLLLDDFVLVHRVFEGLCVQ